MSALTPQERLIMDSWDEGETMRSISRRTGLSYGRVEKTVLLYGPANEHRNHRAKMATGSARLARAIQAERGA